MIGVQKEVVVIQEIFDKLAEGAAPSAVQVGRLAKLTGAELGDFRARWSTLTLDRRLAILTVAGQLAEDDVHLDFSAVLKLCLTDSDGGVRAAAIDGLWEDEEFRTGDLLAKILRDDPDERARTSAALGLARFATRIELGTLYPPTASRVRTALLDAANDRREQREVRRRAVESIGVLSAPEIADLIDRTYADQDPKFRASAIYAMGRNGDDRWLPLVLKDLDDDIPEIRFEAARAAGSLESPRAVVPLINLLDDDDFEVRLAAVGALGSIGGDVARKALEQCTRSDELALRSAATEALGEIDLDANPLTTSPFLNDNTLTI
ncbi:MAG TPA: HEAT repeat domain-containing protein [Chloroflexota bacterium]|nr:HEAT repeat domain-containing protein [Chloroflexota bacterium]